jgi:hypothetical protein
MALASGYGVIGDMRASGAARTPLLLEFDTRTPETPDNEIDVLSLESSLERGSRAIA